MLAHLLAAGRTLANGLLHLFYPGVCRLCGQPLPPALRHFCDPCRNDLVNDTFPSCPRCAGTVGPFAHVAEGCSACRGESYAFEHVLRLGPYEGRLREAVLRLKSWAGDGLADVLGDLWAGHRETRLRELAADEVVPVPLHWMRRWMRGYNQSEALAWALASRLGLPCRPGWLRRIRHTPQQTRQTPTNRRANVKNAFQSAPRANLRGRTILLVDDVMTTGSTANEAARALRNSGAVRVVVAVLARAVG